MRKVILVLRIVCIGFIGISSANAEDGGRDLSNCEDIYQHLRDTISLRECPAGENCVSVTVRLTNDGGSDDEGSFDYCRLEVNSIFNPVPPQTAALEGVKNGITECVPNVEIKIESKSFAFQYNILNPDEFYAYSSFQFTYSDEKNNPLTKGIYFNHFFVGGVERSDAPEIEHDQDEDSDNEENSECSSAVNGIRACYDANDDIICLNAQDTQVDCPPEFRPRALDDVPGGGMGADDDGQAATDGGEGLFCSLNTKASPKGFWFGFGGFVLVGLALAGLRRNIK